MRSVKHGNYYMKNTLIPGCMHSVWCSAVRALRLSHKSGDWLILCLPAVSHHCQKIHPLYWAARLLHYNTRMMHIALFCMQKIWSIHKIYCLQKLLKCSLKYKYGVIFVQTVCRKCDLIIAQKVDYWWPIVWGCCLACTITHKNLDLIGSYCTWWKITWNNLWGVTAAAIRWLQQDLVEHWRSLC